jgi:hypothetical protein
MTGPQWRLIRQIIDLLQYDIGRTDADLAAILNAPVVDVRQAVAVLYRQHRVDRCWSYVVLAPIATAGLGVSAA